MISSIEDYSRPPTQSQIGPSLQMTHERHAIRTSKQHKSHHDTSNRSVVAQTQPATRQLPVTSSELPFTIDRQGDLANLQYGSTDRYKVPRYRTYGHGRLIGLDRRYKIVAKSATERVIDNEAIDSSSRSGHLLHTRQTSSQAETLLTHHDLLENDDFVEQSDYLKLGRKKLSSSNRARDDRLQKANDVRLRHNAENFASESGEGSESSEDETRDDEESINTDAFAAFKNHPDNQKQVELRRRIDYNPEDVDSWLDLIQHQERYFMLSAGLDIHTLNAAQQKTVAEMKVSIYEQALATVKASKDKLVLGLMLEGAKLWDTHEQLAKWTQVISNGCSIELWYSYLNFYQSNAILFTFEKCLEVYVELLKVISELGEEDFHHHYAYVILRLTSFTFHAGFSERSIATWQAVLEYNLCRPAIAVTDLQQFEQFWASEVPRLGEENAKGWSNSCEFEVCPKVDEPFPTLDDSNLIFKWSRVEAERASHDMMPARILDETVEDDPNRVILFSDVWNFIFSTRSVQGNSHLIQAFVLFCGSVPPPHGPSEQTAKCKAWWFDPYVGQFETSSNGGQITDTSILFASEESCLYAWNPLSTQPKSLVQFVTRALTQLAQIQRQDEDLAEYAIALQTNLDASSARKFTKALLKQRPDCLILYNAFALVEMRNDKFDSAYNVWATALSMANSFSETAQSQKAILWHSWIWSLMQRQDFVHAIALLSQVFPDDVVDVQKINAIMNTTNISDNDTEVEDCFRERIPNAIASRAETVPELIDLYAVYGYLRKSHDIDSALRTYSAYEPLVNLRDLNQHIIERLHQLRARLLDFHIRTSPSGYKPKQFVTCLQDSINKYPDNPIFFTLHETCLRRAGMLDRLRADDTQQLSQTRKPNDNVQLFQAIRRETSRPLFSGSTTHSIRRTFENATAPGSPLHQSSAIWRSWVAFESSVSSMPGYKKQKLKDVYLAALRACPGVKNVYMDVFLQSNLSATFDEKELEGVYRSMLDRGLRVRYDISDALEERSDGQG